MNELKNVLPQSFGGDRTNNIHTRSNDKQDKLWFWNMVTNLFIQHGCFTGTESSCALQQFLVKGR